MTGFPSTTIVVAAHKPYWMPSDSMYVPVQAGSFDKESIIGYRRDDEGPQDNISNLNCHLSELTVLYWAWRNIDADAVGLAHYRRHFAGSGERGVLTSKEAQELLQKAPVIVPRKRNYYIERVGDHYDHTFETWQLDLLIQTVADYSPSSVPALYRVLNGTRAHMFNMMVMRRDLLHEYCSWMFPIVRSIEGSANYASMSDFEARMAGRLSEYLLDTWLLTEKHCYVECPIQNLESTNWAKKGGSFLMAKFFGRKYTKSF